MQHTKERELAEVLRDEMVMHGRIQDLLREKPMTIPELAEALQYPDWEVTVWVMAMIRYGLLTELPKARADDYFQYTVAK
jgi:hypothetical protein